MAKRDWIGIDLGQTGALALLPEDGARLVSEVDRSPGAGQACQGAYDLPRRDGRTWMFRRPSVPPGSRRKRHGHEARGLVPVFHAALFPRDVLQRDLGIPR